jgi:hypothetical protein
VTYKEFVITPAAVELPDGNWKLEGSINPAQGEGAGELFEARNPYSSKEAAEQHFIEFARRYIDGTATRADIDHN